MTAILQRFAPATREWFTAAFAAPTAAQTGAWEAISAGHHTLVVAPTGSGKTLAAFLWSLDRIATSPPPTEPRHRCRVLYVSPLKALAVDVDRNLRTPLVGIDQTAARLGLAASDISVGIRTGDTPADQRRAFGRTPPDVLITTPESLFLLLTSAARESLRGVRTVIVDEVHAIAGNKRGAHLALCLERLDALLATPAQRIGLSATVRPIDKTARFLGGRHPVRVVSPPTAKTIDISVQVPVPDMTQLDEREHPYDDDPTRTSAAGPTATTAGPTAANRSIWPAVEERVLDLIEQHRSTIVFTNSRRSAERLCARLNELAADRRTDGSGAGTDAERDEWGRPRGGFGSRQPAEIMAQSGAARGVPAVVARAHHGSVSRVERQQIEEALKSGQLPAVVATSSLELGIDMGAVDLVVQIEAPPSVAAGLQRIGRAGHQVGALSRGVILPKHRGDLLSCAVVTERMAAAEIEELHPPRNPLDVLAQQIVAMVALDTWRVDDLADLVRRAAPFAELPESALHAVLDMLSGRYPSTAFAELRPRLVWDRGTDLLTGRPGAQRLAVTSGGTIPDRGLFGVFLAGAERAARVGELDEEMVYESRVGDVFLLGATSWRIEEITPDRVLVSPAAGQPARMPFWKGDQPGRPVELGRALGARLRALARQEPQAARTALRSTGLDDWAADNLVRYVAEQRSATRALPDDRTIVVERFHDELGDWRLVVHSVFGARVNGPWALAIGQRLTERYGVDAQVMPGDDGIVIRLPEMVDSPPGADLVAFDADEIGRVVEECVGGSALFAARFRECAARALLLPRRDPRRRQPLWQQRQRAAQLLDVARQFPDFPITLETARECLRDVFDMPALVTLMRDLDARRTRLVEVETPRPSPFARSLLFGYVGAFLYEGDVPLAERRAAALTLDSTLLGELLGRIELRELLDPAVLTETDRQLRWLGGHRQPRDAEDVAEMLRILGDLSDAELAERSVDPRWIDELARSRRAIRVRIAGQDRWIAVEDAARMRDALGVALPVGVAEAHLAPVADPLADLVARYARTHGPFDAADCAARFGLGGFVVEQTLRRLATTRGVVAGEFTADRTGTEWCDAEVLRLLRRRSLAALRREIEPVPATTLARFLPHWQQIVRPGRGVDGVAEAVDQLQGVAVPASTLERLILPARVSDYAPAQLDELCATGEVLWAGCGTASGGDGWIRLVFAETAPLLLPPPDPALPLTAVHEAILDALADGSALFFRQLAERAGSSAMTSATTSTAAWATASTPTADDRVPRLETALWELVWAGWLTNDTLAPLRAVLGSAGTRRIRPAPPRVRHRRPGRAILGAQGAPPTLVGRWSRLPAPDPDPTRRCAVAAEVLLERYGVLTRGAVVAEGQPGGFAAVYPVLAAMEERGAARRGYFVDGLGAAQFAVPAAVERLRELAPLLGTDRTGPDPANTVRQPAARVEAAGTHAAGTHASGVEATGAHASGVEAAGAHADRRGAPGAGRAAIRPLVLAATDPANPYGAALSWPERALDAGDGQVAGHRPGRKAGALVVLVSGELALYVERGGRSLLCFTDDDTVLAAAARALAATVTSGALGPISVERADGAPVRESPLHSALAAAGFRATPRGLRLS
ncbi:ATP-dependent helicase [Solwaraspora sp. WMMD406]|uniref:ATP-dependent helicase n=1 Tax=Solwaraspora sp. WMMD406 TaxID=3016095 RepID=UPI002417DB74|nr:ATP-dependent helicase [Solwaraspora sp. WMMD406]MDG4767089.1 ATP-dependent helicase [Solwaraspora sp. WMMD406]